MGHEHSSVTPRREQESVHTMIDVHQAEVHEIQPLLETQHRICEQKISTQS